MDYDLSDEEGGIVPKVLRDGLVFKDEDGQVIFNQYSFCELVKHLLVELVGISYEEASQIVERSPLAEPVADAMGVAIFSHDLPYYWAMFFYYGNGYWQKGIPAQPEDMDAYFALEKQTIFYKGIMPSEKVLDLPMDCNTLTGSVNL